MSFWIKNYEAKRDAATKRAKTILVDGKAECQRRTRDEETDAITWAVAGAPMATSEPIVDERAAEQANNNRLRAEVAKSDAKLVDLDAQIADVKTILGEP